MVVFEYYKYMVELIPQSEKYASISCKIGIQLSNSTGIRRKLSVNELGVGEDSSPARTSIYGSV
jgi:hypothetical protein